VAVSILGEPIGSALLAWWLLDERFVPLQLAGFVVLLAGIFVAARAELADQSGTRVQRDRS
jgi:drug/metabolite transporter (DMT)-like permease